MLDLSEHRLESKAIELEITKFDTFSVIKF